MEDPSSSAARRRERIFDAAVFAPGESSWNIDVESIDADKITVGRSWLLSLAFSSSVYPRGTGVPATAQIEFPPR
eukprot:scaffold33490_cov66-Skeletonema_marinoi.AAC.1